MKIKIREIYERKRIVKEYMDDSVNKMQGIFSSSWEIAMNVMSRMANDNIDLSNDIICEVMNVASYEGVNY